MRILGIALSDWLAILTIGGLFFGVFKKFLISPIQINLDFLSKAIEGFSATMEKFMDGSISDRKELRNDVSKLYTRVEVLEEKERMKRHEKD
ncbi:hypothetical protein [Listeria booriae]|uniref:hypothetical protein n=1 Tax=Listeria booriae TaxID=1552123 RepID=UPI00162ABACF|nr:hypothetical protein [Listeria booriae]MBC1983003.1 hypothetical protein [Listeria booriae]